MIDVSDAAGGVGHNNAFLNRVEDRLDQSLFLREPEQIILNFLRPYAPETFDEFIEEPGFHSRDGDAWATLSS